MSGNDRGLVKFDGQNWTIYNTENSGLTTNGIWALAVDGDGNVWAGPGTDNPPTSGGLIQYDGQNWTAYNTSNSGLPYDRISCLTTDARGNVLIGTRSGLAVYGPGALSAIDSNGDGLVDIKDLLRLIESWGQDDPLVDIAPPFGDGVIDVRDLELLMSYWGESIEDPRLVAHWKLDETDGLMAHNSVNDNNDIVMGGALWKPTGGVKDGALSLDGIDDHISTDFLLDPSVGPFSVFVWIKGSVSGQVIISQTDGTGRGDTWLESELIDGRLMTGLVPPQVGRTVPQPLVSESIITDGQWHHVGLVWDSLYRSLYVDGVEVARDPQPLSPLKSSDGGLYIGADETLDTGTFWLGLIDDVRIYRVALRADEIEALAR